MTIPKKLGDVRVMRTAMEEGTRSMLLAAAATLLSEEGPSALTVRRVADAVNGTSKMIYTYFGGKDGLMEALYRHAFGRFTLVLEGERSEVDPVARLYAMTFAYRDFALASPALYNVMFGDLGRAWEPSLDCRRDAWKSFSALRETILINLPEERRKESTRVTYLMWATMHGVVSLELRKLIGSGQSGKVLFMQAVDAVMHLHGISGRTELNA